MGIMTTEITEKMKVPAKEIESLGIKITYSTSILIREVTMLNLILIEMERYVGATIYDCLRLKGTDVGEYNNYDVETGKEDYSLFGEEYLKIQKRLILLLNELGLSPKQKILREKFKLVGKLNEKLVDFKTKDKRYSLNAIHEKELSFSPVVSCGVSPV